MTQPVLMARGLRFAWSEAPLFEGLDLDLPAGLSVLTGEDGSGKSSLLALLAGARSPQQGRLQADGVWLDEQPDAYRQKVFWIDPQTEAHDAMPAAGYLQSLAAHWPRCSPVALEDLVDGFGLEPHLVKPLYMLSAGSRRKVWLTAAFAAGAAVTLIDQPFAALDAPSARFLTELLVDVQHHPTRAWLIADHEAPPGLPGLRRLHLLNGRCALQQA